MDRVIQLYDYLIVTYGSWGCALMVVTLVLFVVQMWYYLGRYARLAKYRNGSGRGKVNEVDGVSVVVVLRDDRWYLDTVLPKLLEQDYPDFEVMVVSVATDEDFEDELALMKERYPNLSTTRIEPDPRFPISNKMAYNVGIKGVRYENIVLTTADALPVSGKWLSCMAKGFEGGDVVIAYCGMRRKFGFAGGIIACDRLMSSVRYLSSAIRRRPYRGIIQNIGFTRKIYFDNRGFDHLNMNIGEDDLFIQKIASGDNVSVVMNPHATMRQEQWGGLGWWRARRRFYDAAYKFYPVWAKNQIEWELGSRLLFYVTVAVLVAVMPPEIKAGAGALWLLRLLVVRNRMWKVRKRLGEKKLGWTLMLHDFVSPFVEPVLAVGRKLFPAAGVWR